jgi:hypothetical protein
LIDNWGIFTVSSALFVGKAFNENVVEVKPNESASTHIKGLSVA